MLRRIYRSFFVIPLEVHSLDSKMIWPLKQT